MWEDGGGELMKRRRGGSSPKKSVLFRCWFCIHWSFGMNRNPEECTLKATVLIQRPECIHRIWAEKGFRGGKSVTPRTWWKDSCCAGGCGGGVGVVSESRGVLWSGVCRFSPALKKARRKPSGGVYTEPSSSFAVKRRNNNQSRLKGRKCTVTIDHNPTSKR